MRKIALFLTTLSVFAISCKEDDVTQLPDNPSQENPQLGKGEFIPKGSLPAQIRIEGFQCPFQEAAYSDNHMLIATNDGVWRSNLNGVNWSQSGLQGEIITAVYADPYTPKKVFAGVLAQDSTDGTNIYISSDGGSSWTRAQSGIYDNKTLNRYENIARFTVRPNQPQHVFANLFGGGTVAVSKDGGATWDRMNYEQESQFGYPAGIEFIRDDATKIYQGAELPLDDAWLATYDINDSDPVKLENYKRLVDINTWGNRRPNSLRSFAVSSDKLYVGQEGALSVYSDSGVKFIFKSDGNNFPYTYVKGIWVNPQNPKHLLFGGNLNAAEQPMSLYESIDGGKTVFRYTNKQGYNNPVVLEIVETDHNPILLMKERSGGNVGAIEFKPSKE